MLFQSNQQVKRSPLDKTNAILGTIPSTILGTMYVYHCLEPQTSKIEPPIPKIEQQFSVENPFCALLIHNISKQRQNKVKDTTGYGTNNKHRALKAIPDKLFPHTLPKDDWPKL